MSMLVYSHSVAFYNHWTILLCIPTTPSLFFTFNVPSNDSSDVSAHIKSKQIELSRPPQWNGSGIDLYSLFQLYGREDP